MGSVNPEREQFKALFSGVPQGTPVVMVNLLRFRERADYGDGDHGLSGEEAYALYIRESTPHIADVGAELVWRGRAHATVIGPIDEAWDEVLLVRYPSVAKFAEMVTRPAYQALAVHRTAAILDSRLIATVAE